MVVSSENTPSKKCKLICRNFCLTYRGQTLKQVASFVILLQYLRFPFSSFLFLHTLLKPFLISQGFSPTLCTSFTTSRFAHYFCVRSCCCTCFPMKHEVSFLAEHSSITCCLCPMMQYTIKLCIADEAYSSLSASVNCLFKFQNRADTCENLASVSLSTHMHHP